MLTHAARVVLTGGADSLPGLAALLRHEGLGVLERPLLSFAPPSDWSALDGALHARDQYHALAVTSPRAAQAVLQRVDWLRLAPETLPPVWTGPASVAALATRFPFVRQPDPECPTPTSLGVQLATAMIEAGVASPVLFPCGDHHRDELIDLLGARGVRAEPVICYRTLLASIGQAFRAISQADLLVVTSPRVAALLAAVPLTASRPALVALGPTTARTAARSGWTPDAIADRPTPSEVLGAILPLLSGVR
jgi:uroporphyrinogen-III synthase